MNSEEIIFDDYEIGFENIKLASSSSSQQAELISRRIAAENTKNKHITKNLENTSDSDEMQETNQIRNNRLFLQPAEDSPFGHGLYPLKKFSLQIGNRKLNFKIITVNREVAEAHNTTNTAAYLRSMARRELIEQETPNHEKQSRKNSENLSSGQENESYFSEE